MNEVDTKARNSTKGAAFAAGQGLAAPGNDVDAGGANLAKPFPTQEGGAGHNKGRLKPGTEIHHVSGIQNKNGSSGNGTYTIPDGAQIKSRGGDVTPK